jgi:hypothetical protein
MKTRPFVLACTLPVVLCALADTRSHASQLDRSAFARAVTKIRLTKEAVGSDGTLYYDSQASTESDVIRLLGTPDDILTPQDPNGPPEGEKELCYGTNGHLTFPTLGVVRIDRRGKVKQVTGLIGEPPSVSLLSESELRRLLRVVATVPDPSPSASQRWNPAPLIGAVNRLQPIGKTKVLVVVEEYVRITTRFVRPDTAFPSHSGLFPLLALLFEGTDKLAVPPFATIRVADGIPVLLQASRGGTGDYGFYSQHLDPFRELRLRSGRLTPGTKPLRVLDLLDRSNEWRGRDASSTTPMRHQVMFQLLRLIEPAYRPPVGEDPRNVREDEIEVRWQKIRMKTDNLTFRWDFRLQKYKVVK